MKKKMIVILCVTPFLLAAAAVLAYNFHTLLSGELTFSVHPSIVLSALRDVDKVRIFFLIFAGAMLLFLLCAAFFSPSATRSSNTTMRVLPKIRIPVAAGHGEYGTAQFMDVGELRRHFAHCTLDPKRLRQLTKEANADEARTERPAVRLG